MDIRTQLQLNETFEVDKIIEQLRLNLRNNLHKRGYVIGLSGGIDSSVCAALAVKAVGPNKVFALLLPEKDSSGNSTLRGKMVAEQLGIEYELFDIAPTLEAIGCYNQRDQAIRRIFPDYALDWKCKIVISGGQEGQFNHFNLVVETPDGELLKERMGLNEYLQVVAATNYKQRIRKTVEYFHADRLNYAVLGTPNRLEYDQGFFVKNGDGAADIKPIAHLYKTQVYALARYLELPVEICEAVPSTDTYSLTQGQDEFYFALPYDKMDIALWGYNHNVSVSELSENLGISNEQSKRIYNDIEMKRKTTAYLHWSPLLIEPVNGPLAKPATINP
ncbi:NAD(+) synthase [Photobacterium sagamiensis]|uniref:NAD(+) synthase n=1 Tax=Photobacterium sagamiensis TaxID=2910241 RepID=UPI003D0AF04A